MVHQDLDRFMFGFYESTLPTNVTVIVSLNNFFKDLVSPKRLALAGIAVILIKTFLGTLVFGHAWLLHYTICHSFHFC